MGQDPDHKTAAEAHNADDNANTPVARAAAERRRFKRVRLDLSGRLFVPADGREARCEILDMSPGGAAVRSELMPDPETPVVIYVDGFGRFEGQVVRAGESAFAMKFICSALKRERIAEQLIVHLNKALLGSDDVRRHDRAPMQGLTRFTRHDGEMVRCEVLDLSLSGVSVKTDARPAIGEYVLIGQMAGRVARHHNDGIGIEFVGVPHDKPVERATKLAAVR